MKTGIFCGSFNPIHIGHLALANYLCEYGELDEVWFVITPQNPLKQQSGLLVNSVRMKLVEAAVSEYPRFCASDFEFGLPSPSYTVHTLDKLKEVYPQKTFFLVIGSDNWLIFDKWKEPERIIAENKILIYPRPHYPIDNSKPLPDTVRVVNAPLLDVSSAFIREALMNGRDIRFFLHPEVWKMISQLAEWRMK
ncbi:Nicotinate-nucleotide adenylyltransferase [termite gut metagenome]|uniref:Nicotinate-nucleotide adenylyltransferase n=1 Tax=termite gut metagenome TaxID=433724 RepID=A0A5J4QM94_9ZZZZ